MSETTPAPAEQPEANPTSPAEQPNRNLPWYLLSWRRVGLAFWHFFRNTYLTYRDSRASMLAASISYYLLLTLIPFLFLVVATLGLIYGDNNKAKQDVIADVQEHMPQAGPAVERSIDFIMDSWKTLGIIGVLGLLWTSKNTVFAVNFALDRIFGGTRVKKLWKRLLDTLLMIIAICALFILSNASSLVVSYIQTRTWLHGVAFDYLVQGMLPYVMGIVLSTLFFFALFFITPQTRPDWKRTLAGAFVSSFLWEALRSVIGRYIVSQTLEYREIYGTLATIIFVILWSYLFSISLVTGACATQALRSFEEEQVL